MQFASDYVLEAEEEEFENICQMEYDNGMDVSDDEAKDKASDGADWKKDSKYKWKMKTKIEDVPTDDERSRSEDDAEENGTNVPKADTNIVAIQFDMDTPIEDMFEKPPVRCSKCSAIFSSISKLESVGAKKVWPCEFCKEETTVDMTNFQMPYQRDVTYLLCEASARQEDKDDPIIIFCMDISTSMSTTSEITGEQLMNILGSKKNIQHDGPNFVSTLEVMKAAVGHQLEQIANKYPDRRVGLITFASEVVIIGDGSQEKVTVEDRSDLDSVENLRHTAQAAALPRAIQQTCDGLSEITRNLVTAGTTALGPALVIAVTMAGTQPGSEVILFTDGVANTGIYGPNLYNMMAEEASQKGVTISVITLEGANCDVKDLGILADKTGGQVNKVNSRELNEQFNKIIMDEVILSQVKSNFIMDDDLYIVDKDNPNNQQSRAQENHGNVKNVDMTKTFAFGKRKRDQKDDNVKIKDVKTVERCPGERTKSRPFQIQIEYIDKDGNLCLRVVTQLKPVTQDRTKAEKSLNVEVLCTHAAHESAGLVLKEKYDEAREVALTNQRLVWRRVHTEGSSEKDKQTYKLVFKQLKDVDELAKEQKKNKSKLSDDAASMLYNLRSKTFISKQDSEGFMTEAEFQECLRLHHSDCEQGPTVMTQHFIM